MERGKKWRFAKFYLSLLIILLENNNELENVENLRSMVKEVNMTQVMDEEILSDSVYYFDLTKSELVLARA